MSEMDIDRRPLGCGPGRFDMTFPALAASALFLDFDGTLVELASTPDAVRIPPVLPPLLKRLASETGGAVALVSGRRLADVERFLPGFRGPIVGSHGAERRLSGARDVHPAAGSKALQDLKRSVCDWASGTNVLVEDKPVSIVLHFRQVPYLQAEVESAMAGIVARYDGFILHRAKMAVEIKPDGISKAAAVRELLAGPFRGRWPLAVGDDATDETMFKEAAKAGGASIKIGEGATSAQCRLASPAQLHETLQSWIDRDMDR